MATSRMQASRQRLDFEPSSLQTLHQYGVSWQHQPVWCAGTGRRVNWQLHPEVVTRRLGDAVVLVNLTSNEIYELNSTGARALELIQAGAGRDELVAQLAAEFAADRSTVGDDVDRLVGELEQAGLLYDRHE